MNWRQRKGSVITEAALVFPMVILAVVSVIVTLTVFHQQAGIKAQLHQTVRQTGGMVVGVWQSGNWQADDAGLYQGSLYGSLLNGAENAERGKALLEDELKAKELIPVGYQAELTYQYHILFPKVKGSVSGLFGGVFLLNRKTEVGSAWAYAVDEAQLLRNLQYATEKGVLWLEGAENKVE